MAYALRTCEVCKIEYRPTYGRQRTCGRICGALMIADAGPRVRIIGYRNCLRCNALFVVRRGRKYACSDACMFDRMRSRPYAARPNRKPPERPFSDDRVCVECLAPYVARGANQRYCGKACAARAQRRVRRITEGRAAVSTATRRRVYARDAEQCHLCRWSVRLDESDDAHPWLATVDHLVPHSHGGSDSEENLATAHRWCNTVRSDVPVDAARVVLVGNPPPDTWDLAEYRAVAARIADSLTAAA